jgi:hypothetical protein
MTQSRIQCHRAATNATELHLNLTKVVHLQCSWIIREHLAKLRGGWEHLGVLRSCGEGYRWVWDIAYDVRTESHLVDLEHELKY